MFDKFSFLIVTSKHELAGNMPLNSLQKQIHVLESNGVCVTLLVDPNIVTLEKQLIKRRFDCAYSTTLHCYKKEGNKIIKHNYNVYRIFEQYHQRHIGSDVFTQLLVNDKTICSNRSGIGLSGILLTKNNLDNLDEFTNDLNQYPYILKPNLLSCSIGISKESIVHDLHELKKKTIELFNRLPQINEIRVEKYLQNFREFTVAVLGNGEGKCFSVTELDFTLSRDIKIFSEEQKNTPLDARQVKYKLVKEVEIYNELVFHAERLFDWFKMRDNARFDFLYSERAYLIDVNAIPVTGNSLTWEWQERFSFNKNNGLALILCSFYYRSLASGYPIPLPQDVLKLVPSELILKLQATSPIDKQPESSPPTEECERSSLYTMVDRVGAESEVLVFLKALVILVKPALIVETGTYNGASSIAMAQGLKTNKFGKLITIEIDGFLYKKAVRNLSGFPVEVVNSSSLLFNLKEEKIDILFLDSHRPIRKQEFYHFLPKLTLNSLIVWHDSSQSQQVVYNHITELYNDKIIDRIDMPTPRGLTICKLKQSYKMESSDT